MKKFFIKDGKKKNVLLVGLGILGGGTTMAKFILKEGGVLTVTDLRDKSILKDEIKQVEKYALQYKTKVKFVLGEHTLELFDNSDEVLFNPAVPYFSKWPVYCKNKGIKFYNDMTLFQEYLAYKYEGKKAPKQIWVTGTRGKSTTSTFIKNVLGSKAILTGNVPGSGLQKMCDKRCDYFVLETSNYQLEYPIENKDIQEPEVAVLTNIFVDHINRHKTFEEYKRVKHLIYSYNKNCTLLLNENEESVKDIWEEKKHGNLKLVNKFLNLSKLSFNQNVSASFALEIGKIFGIKENIALKRIKATKLPPMRQEVIKDTKALRVINDSTATSPEGLIACIQNFEGANFIIGGTDADLDFTKLVKEIQEKKLIEENRVFFLEGTATNKILEQLNLSDKKIVFNNFETLLKELKKRINSKTKTTIILSPGAKSFGLFKNEYDRGVSFNKAVKKILK